jgi:hypothetical protein
MTSEDIERKLHDKLLITMRENLENKRDMLRTDLADVDAALEALDANPEVSKVLELLAKAGARL